MKCLIKFRKPWGLWKHMLIANLREEKILHHLKKCQASKIIFDFKNCRYFTVAGYIKPGGRGKVWGLGHLHSGEDTHKHTFIHSNQHLLNCALGIQR